MLDVESDKDSQPATRCPESNDAMDPALADREAEINAADVDLTELGAPADVEAPESPTPRPSARAVDLIVQHETGGRAYYERVIKSRPIWPGGSSGVTIGFGYDIGYVSPAKLRRDWARLGATALDRLQQACGVTGQEAKPLAKLMHDLRVSWDDGDAVFGAATLPDFVSLTNRSLPNCGALPRHSFGALVSLTFNRGASYGRAGDRFSEMRQIKSAMAAQQFDRIPDLILAMSRIWIGTDIEAEMTRRRRNESQLFVDGLRAGASGGEVEGLGDGPMEEVSDGPSDEDFFSDPEPSAKLPDVSFLETTETVRWASDADSEDYAHLGGLRRDVQFSLNADDLERLCALNEYPIAGQNRPILFGLRGCGIVSGADGGSFQSSVSLVDRRPDHKTTRCVMGVWDRAAKRLAVFPASTVPNEAAVRQWKTHRNAGNMLPTGAYGYIVGPHNGKPGCLLLRRTLAEKWRVVVRRSSDDLCYEQTDVVDPCTPGDNIHPAFFRVPAFSSLGCQVVEGSATTAGEHKGPWARFRIAAGLTTDAGPAGSYLYVLTTAAELRLVAGAASSDLRRLRYGSRGEAVRRLQLRMDLPEPDGRFGVETSVAWRRKQEALSGGRSDGVYAPAHDALLGWGVFAPT